MLVPAVKRANYTHWKRKNDQRGKTKVRSGREIKANGNPMQVQVVNGRNTQAEKRDVNKNRKGEEKSTAA